MRLGLSETSSLQSHVRPIQAQVPFLNTSSWVCTDGLKAGSAYYCNCIQAESSFHFRQRAHQNRLFFFPPPLPPSPLFYLPTSHSKSQKQKSKTTPAYLFIVHCSFFLSFFLSFFCVVIHSSLSTPFPSSLSSPCHGRPH